MKRLVIALMLCVVLATAGFVAVAGLRRPVATSTEATALPTSITLPEPTLTATASPTFTESPTVTPSPTPTPTPSTTPTLTATLATRVLVVIVDNPALASVISSRGTLTPTGTPTPLLTVAVPVPPTSVDIALASTANAASPGWVRYEDDDPAIVYNGRWERYGDGKTFRASAYHYKFTSDTNATATLHFLGGGLRVRYAASSMGGVFEIRVDGRLVRTVDSYYPKSQDRLGAFLTTEIWGLYNGWHTLEVISTERKNFASGGTVNALDAIDVYQVGGVPTDLPTALPTGSPTPTPSPVPAQHIAVIVAPPTVQATATPAAPKVVSVSLLIAYDENNNKAVDPAEGVSGIPVRLVTTGTNQVIGSGYTNAEGYVHVEAMTDVPVRLVVPYFSKFWELSKSATGEQRFTLLLQPGNQPGLIP